MRRSFGFSEFRLRSYCAVYGGFGISLVGNAIRASFRHRAARDRGARNLWLFAPIDLVWLHHNWHQTHHEQPTVPWIYLPSNRPRRANGANSCCGTICECGADRVSPTNTWRTVMPSELSAEAVTMKRPAFDLGTGSRLAMIALGYLPLLHVAATIGFATAVAAAILAAGRRLDRHRDGLFAPAVGRIAGETFVSVGDACRTNAVRRNRPAFCAGGISRNGRWSSIVCRCWKNCSDWFPVCTRPGCDCGARKSADLSIGRRACKCSTARFCGSARVW